MVEISEEEVVNLDNLADGLSEVRKYKSKPQKETPKYSETPESAEPPKREKLKGGVIAFFIFALALLLSVIGYVTVVYGNIPFIDKWRNNCIESAMSKEEYKSLVVAVFPDRLIDEVVSKQNDSEKE